MQKPRCGGACVRMMHLMSCSHQQWGWCGVTSLTFLRHSYQRPNGCMLRGHAERCKTVRVDIAGVITVEVIEARLPRRISVTKKEKPLNPYAAIVVGHSHIAIRCVAPADCRSRAVRQHGIGQRRQ